MAMRAFLRLAQSETGQVLPMAAIGMLVIAGLVGGGVDMGRSYRVQNRLQAACDAGTLAGRKAVTSQGYDTTARNEATKYFNVNFDSTAMGARDVVFSTNSADNGNTIKATATAKIDTTVMRIFRISEFNMTVNCTAAMGVGNSDVMMVLDTTGSMAWTLAGSTQTRLQALQAAMKNFYDTVETATASSNSRIRYGFVPYSQTANVGKLIYNLNPNYLADTNTIQSRRPVYTGSPARFASWSYEPVTYNVAGYKASQSVVTPTGTNGANETSVWAGCVEERATVANATFSFSTVTGISPSGATDLDIDTAPTSTATTKWRPYWPEIAYNRTMWNGWAWVPSPAGAAAGDKAFGACPQQAQLLREMTSGEFDAYADSLVAVGGTYHDVGMIWGGRLSSPTGIFASNVNAAPSNGGEVARHLIFMTDGEMAPNVWLYGTYGIEFNDQRITGGNYGDNLNRHNSRFLALCQAVKARGIRVWVIAFASGLTTELQTCASAQSAFTASNASQLNAAFQEIAKQVGELRMTN